MTADAPATNATVEIRATQLEAFQALARSVNQLLRDSKDFRQCVEHKRVARPPTVSAKADTYPAVRVRRAARRLLRRGR